MNNKKISVKWYNNGTSYEETYFIKLHILTRLLIRKRKHFPNMLTGVNNMQSIREIRWYERPNNFYNDRNDT